MNYGEAIKLWNERHVKHAKEAKIGKFRSLRRKESQDIANSYHAQTKVRLLKRVTESDDYKPEMREVLYENLAITEHLRWNAAHEMLGYSRNEDGDCCDEDKMRHNCLVRWEELDKIPGASVYDYKHFDRIVVTTSELLNPQN